MPRLKRVVGSTNMGDKMEEGKMGEVFEWCRIAKSHLIENRDFEETDFLPHNERSIRISAVQTNAQSNKNV